MRKHWLSNRSTGMNPLSSNSLCTFFVLYIINTGLTVSTFVNMDHSKALNLTDVNGMEHAIEPYHICVMLALGWTCFFSSYVMNFIYYKIHPSGVDFKKKRFRNRLHFYFCGFDINHFMQNSKLQEFSNDSTTYILPCNVFFFCML